MSSREECWGKYAAHLKIWYVSTYKGHLGSTKAINDGRLIRKIALKERDSLTYQDLKDGGMSEFGAKTIILYISNTKDSYMGRCITDTGGFDSEVECMGDSDCPPGYRCRGRGKDSLCVEEAEPLKVESPLIGLPNVKAGGLLSGLQIGTGTKAIVTIIGGLFVLILLLVALGYSGLGGAAGKAAEKRV